MKKWQKVVTGLACTALVLSVAGTVGYKNYVKPVVEEKIDKVIEKAETVVKDDSIQKQIDDMAQSMIDDGVISLDTMPTYSKLKLENEEKRKVQQEQASNADSKASETEEAEKDNTASENREKTSKTNKDNKTSEKNSPSKENDKKTQAPTSTPVPTVKPTPTPTVKPTPAPTPTPTPTPVPENNSNKSLQEKLKGAMSADEFSFALSMYSRVDIGHAQSLLATDRAAAKEYIYSRVSPAEISRALEIYAKYAYLLK